MRPKVLIKVNQGTCAEGGGAEQLLGSLVLHDTYPQLSGHVVTGYGSRLLQRAYCGAVSHSKLLVWYAEA